MQVLCNLYQDGLAWADCSFWGFPRITSPTGLHGVKLREALMAGRILCQLPYLCFLTFPFTVRAGGVKEGRSEAANQAVSYVGIPFWVLKGMILSLLVNLKGPHLEVFYIASVSVAMCLSKHLKI